MKRLKQIIAIIMMLCICTNVALAQDIRVCINGELINMDVPPLAENGRTMVPVRGGT